MTKKNIAVLGCGPAGLLAAYAVMQCGHNPIIISKKIKSPMGGAQYLHEPIKGLTSPTPDTVVTYRIRGDVHTYARKVYGDHQPSFISMTFLRDGDQRDAWSLTTVYEGLWNMFKHSIMPTQVDALAVKDNLEMGAVDYVFSTIPLPAICKVGHAFTDQRVWIAQRALEPIPPGTILYDGTHDRSWYRESNLFGWEGTEWGASIGERAKPPLPGLIKVNKPTRTNCDCWEDEPRVVKLGRFGRWEKGVLTHHAYQQAIKAMGESS